jgi:hypothetical protein
MKSRIRRILAVLATSAAAVTLSTGATHAAEAVKPTSWASGYVGTSVGMSKTYSYSAGSGQVLTKNDDTDFAYIVFGGYQFIKYFGLTAAWVDLGSTSYAGTVPGDGAFTDRLGANGFALMPMGFWPVAPKHTLFSYVGPFHWSQTVDYNAAVSGPYHTTDHGTSLCTGVGYNWYAIDHNLGIHVEYARFFGVGDNTNSGHRYDRDFVSVGMVWSFR